MTRAQHYIGNFLNKLQGVWSVRHVCIGLHTTWDVVGMSTMVVAHWGWIAKVMCKCSKLENRKSGLHRAILGSDGWKRTEAVVHASTQLVTLQRWLQQLGMCLTWITKATHKCGIVGSANNNLYWESETQGEEHQKVTRNYKNGIFRGERAGVLPRRVIVEVHAQYKKQIIIIVVQNQGWFPSSAYTRVPVCDFVCDFRNW